MPELGTRVHDKYELLQLIAVGGMGEVFLAKDLLLARTVAIKFLQKPTVTSEDSLERFQREGKILAGIVRENIVRIYQFGYFDEQPFIVMEYVEGLTLSQHIKKKGYLPPEEAVEVALQVSEAVDYLHKNGIIHRDLKPSNVMVCDEDKGQLAVKIIDFGLAKEDERTGSLGVTAAGNTAVGSFPYLSPEQCIGKPADVRSEVYSMGCILYQCLVGMPPFVDSSSIVLMRMHVESDPPRLSGALSASVFGERLERVIFKALAKDPDERYQSLSDLADDLRTIKDKTSAVNSSAKVTTIPSSKRKQERKNRLILLVSLAAAGLCVAVAFVVIWPRLQAGTQQAWTRAPYEHDAIAKSSSDRSAELFKENRFSESLMYARQAVRRLSTQTHSGEQRD